MIAWFRAKAAEFTAIADNLENTFSGSGAVIRPQLNGLGPEVTVEQIRGKMGSNALRPADIAGVLGTSKLRVIEVINKHPDIFEKFGKGWVKVK